MKKITTYFTVVAGILLAALGGGMFGAYLVTAQMQASMSDGPDHSSDLSSNKEIVYVEESQVIDTVKKISPSVVSIVISKELPQYSDSSDPFFLFGFPFGQPELELNGDVESKNIQVGGGSGFIISEDGLIVTNRHVVQDEDADYTVITNDGREFNAQVLARDTLSDFAILKLLETGENKIRDLSVVELGDSDTLQIGQKVIAIGNALAEFQNTVTTGIISGTDRNIIAGSMRFSEELVNLIQTDAAINPGNSGGPLVNLDGEVIGINTAIAASGQGIGFAIPINEVKSLIKTVQKEGKIIRPFLGVRFMMLDEQLAKELGIEVETGALLVGDEARGEFAVLPGSPADKAGLKIKDVILEMDGQEVNIENPLNLILAEKKVGEEVKLKVWRAGELIDVELELAASEVQ